jgi:hypothetical protein
MAKTVVTAEDLDGMTSAERDAVFEAAVVRDLDTVPPAFLERVRDRFILNQEGLDHRS